MKVICTDNQELTSLPLLETDAYLMREEAYLTISIVSKLFKYMGFVSKQNPDYNVTQQLNHPMKMTLDFIITCLNCMRETIHT